MGRREDYVPRADGDFDTWQNAFVSYVIANSGLLGLTLTDVTELQVAQATWNAAYPSHITAQNTARAKAEIKDDARDTFETVIRQKTKKVQARPETTDAQKEGLGVTVIDTTKTPLSEQIVQTEPLPVVEAKCTGPKQVRIDWYPTQAPGESEALPQGIDGVVIWYAEGGIPATEDGWRFLAMDTNSPYIHYVNNNTTVTIAYKAQWFDRRKRMGPFCDPVTVAVTA
ncbi:MAG: hypothetical protein HY769_02940 [Candidatus Stahlbacteria bacterium]|nr:hypothetical protein [Candidatus Stahlbacteria bacterium]